MSVDGPSELDLEDASDATGARKRRRPAISCARCRRRKIKCDQCVPCNNCQRAKVDDCTYPETHTPAKRASRGVASKSPPRQVIPQLPLRYPEPRDRRASGHVTASEHSTPASRQSKHLSSHSALAEHELSRRGSVASPYSNPAVLRAQISNLQAALTTLKQTQESHKKDAKQNLTGPHFAHQSRWLNQTPLYTKVLRTLAKVQDEKGDLYHGLAACKAAGAWIQEHILEAKASSSQTAASGLPERDLSDELLDEYFSLFEGVFRVLHVPTFFNEYEKYWHYPSSARPLFLHQLRVCLALGASSHPNAPALAHLRLRWLYDARGSLVDHPARRKKSTLEDLQLRCLLCIAFANEPGPESNAWVEAGDLMRNAMALDLHRDPDHLGALSVKQAILRRRLWVTILELNLLCALQANQAPLITTADFDTCPPADVIDDELDDLSTGEHLGIHLNRENRTSVQSAFYASWPIRSKVVAQLASVKKDPDYESVLDLHRIFSKERSTFRQIVKDASGKSQRVALRGNTTAQASIADIIMSRYMLALHLPVLGPVIRNPKFHFSRRMAASTAIEMGQMCGILQSHNLNGSTPDALLQTQQRIQILFISSAGIFRYIAVQSLYALMLEFVTSSEESLDSDISFSGCNERELLDHVHDIQKWTEGRVKKGLFDFHNCCFLAAAYAYGHHAGEAPDVRESAMVEAALGSVQRCLAALEDIKAQMRDSQGGNLQNPPAAALPELSGAVDFDLMGDFNWADMSLPMFDWSHQALL